MPFIPAVNCARVEFRMTLDGQRIENVPHFRFLSGAPSAADLAALATFCQTWWADTYADVLCDDVVLSEVVATGLNSELGPQGTQGGLGATGAITAEPVPNNVALCLTKRTANIGRSARGRWYVPGIDESIVIRSVMTQSNADSFAARVHDLLVDNPPSGWEGVIVSYQHNNAALTTAAIYPITSVIARDGIVDSQRRRLPGRGS